MVAQKVAHCNKATLDIKLKHCFTRPMTAITDAIEKTEGGQAALARAIGVSPQAVSQWVTKRRPVPPRLAIAIEAATGVSRHDLRPDVFGPAPDQAEAA